MSLQNTFCEFLEREDAPIYCGVQHPLKFPVSVSCVLLAARFLRQVAVFVALAPSAVFMCRQD